MDSLHKRYFYKLATNLIGAAISLVALAIVPRGLGPQAYGDFNFLTSFFRQVVSFFDTGTSLCFYTKLSQRPLESALISFYLYFFIIVSSIMFVLLLIAQSSQISPLLWPNQTLFYILCGVLWGILAWFSDITNKMADAFGITVSTEIARMLQKIIGLVILIGLFFIGQLSLRNYFIYHFFIMLFLIAAFIWLMKTQGHIRNLFGKLNVAQIKSYVKEFYVYSHPLALYALVGMVVGIFDRWLLQVFGGSVQQAFFALASQIGASCFLFTSAMTQLLTREFAIAYEQRDLDHMAHLFRRYIPLLFSIAAFFSCFIAVQAKKVIYIMGGKSFGGAVAALTIMAFYPIYQTYGQLTGALFYATGQTALYRNIRITFMILGLPVTYMLIAPHARMGLGAGGLGLSIKMVLFQVIGNNVMLYYSTRFLGLTFWRYVRHQCLCISSLLLVSFLVVTGIDHIAGFQNKVFLSFFIAGIVYSLLILALAYFQPMVFGMKREDILLLKKSVSEILSGS
jgi:O-antigen/teichoic acid export membrane protein